MMTERLTDDELRSLIALAGQASCPLNVSEDGGGDGWLIAELPTGEASGSILLVTDGIASDECGLPADDARLIVTAVNAAGSMARELLERRAAAESGR